MIFARYARWLHTQWPAGVVEKLPLVNEDGSTNVPGLYVTGDLTGVPLLKFASDGGARAVRTILGDTAFQRERQAATAAGEHILDLAIVGAGVSGMAAALEARKAGLSFEVLEASEPFSTIVNFPKAKPIYTYPTDMTPAGDLQFTERSGVKEGLLNELRERTLGAGIAVRQARAERVLRTRGGLEVQLAGGESVRARRVVVAIGRSGDFRKLGVPGEDLDKVYNRLHDPNDFAGQDVLVVGGGDSALETAIALAERGANVTLSYRKPEFSRPKPENVEKARALAAGPRTGGHRPAGRLTLMMASRVRAILADEVDLADEAGAVRTLKNDVVFSMIGREPPLEFFRRSGVRVRGEWRPATWIGFALFMLFCVFLYHWKKDIGIPVYGWFSSARWFPFNVPGLFDAVGGTVAEWSGRRTHLLYTLKTSMASPGFYYTLAYSAIVVVFGIRRIRRRRTPYVRAQTLTLMAIQCLPLFILPEIVLPWAGRNGWFVRGTAVGAIADQFFEPTDAPTADQLAAAGFDDPQDWEHPIGVERAYWRAYGFVLAWPLFVANFFTDRPMWGWLVVGSLQTFVLIPFMIRRWGKGAYCGWICSCGALAETLGDAHRHKMPHGPAWNRLNMVGQAVLLVAFVLLALRIAGWVLPDSGIAGVYAALLGGIPFLSYYWFVDLFLAGILGVGCYFWFSGRVWCRFACPLAALMHVYARFSQFRILAEKKKCISCNVCTSVCHQGIDVMNFANKGLPMEDPECVRCSACVQSCPTGVLTFGRVDRHSGEVLGTDRLAASPVQYVELRRAPS